MRKGYLIFLPLLILLLGGCSVTVVNPEQTYSHFEEVNVFEKRSTTTCTRMCASSYYVTVEKDGQKVELNINDKNIYNTLKEGTLINLSYDKTFTVQNIEFVLFKKQPEKVEEVGIDVKEAENEVEVENK